MNGRCQLAVCNSLFSTGGNSALSAEVAHSYIQRM